MCAMSPDWPTLSAFQLPCFWNSQGCRALQPWARISERLRRWLGPEPALAWPSTGVGFGPETVVGRLNQHAIVATVLCLLLRGRRTAARYSRLGPTFLRSPRQTIGLEEVLR